MIIESNNLMKLRCFIGYHKWSPWVDYPNIKKISYRHFFTINDDVPTQTKTCSLCNIKKMRIVRGE